MGKIHPSSGEMVACVGGDAEQVNLLTTHLNQLIHFTNTRWKPCVLQAWPEGISYFSGCGNKILSKGGLRRKGLFWSHSLGMQFIMVGKSSGLRHLVILHPELGRKQR